MNMADIVQVMEHTILLYTYTFDKSIAKIENLFKQILHVIS